MSKKEMMLSAFSARLLLAGLLLGAGGIWYANSNLFSPEAKVIRACGVSETSSPDQRACYEKEFQKITREGGSGPALEVLGAIYTRYGIEYGDCHVTAHAIGHEAYQLYPSPIEAFSQLEQETACSSGYYHGIIEEFMADGHTLEQAATEICKGATAVDVSDRGRNQCYHGLGHVLMAFSDYDLPRALSLCELDPERRNQDSCFHGTFMENILAGHFRKEVVSPWVRPEDPLYPCNTLDSKYRRLCLNWVSTLTLRFQTKDPKEAIKTCDTLSEGWEKFECYMGMGREFTSFYNHDLPKIRDACLAGDPRFASACLRSVAQNLINAEGGFGEASRFCKIVPGVHQPACAHAAGLMAVGMRISSDERRRVCKRYFANQQEPCLVGAGEKNGPSVDL